MDINYVVIPAIIVLGSAMAVCCSLRRIVLLKRSGQSTIRKLIERMLLGAFAAAFGAVGLSTAFNAIALYWYPEAALRSARKVGFSATFPALRSAAPGSL
jgi:hypothetical protein